MIWEVRVFDEMDLWPLAVWLAPDVRVIALVSKCISSHSIKSSLLHVSWSMSPSYYVMTLWREDEILVPSLTEDKKYTRYITVYLFVLYEH